MLDAVVEQLELQAGQVDAIAVHARLPLAHVEQVVLG